VIHHFLPRAGRRGQDIIAFLIFLVRDDPHGDNRSQEGRMAMDEDRDDKPGGAGIHPRPDVPVPPVEPLALFEILARENADALTAFLRASLYDAAAVDDLFQETLLIAWRKIGEYDRTRPFGAWLRGIARRLVLAHAHQSAREIPVSSERVLDYLDQRLEQVECQPGDTLDEKIAALRDCLARLEPMYREPLDLHYDQRRTTEWIAEKLETTKDAIQKRLQRARLQLADCLERRAVLTPTDG
jgi:RNA polymerase sigma factor (sigma-70 family)